MTEASETQTPTATPPPKPGLDVRAIAESALLMDVTVLLVLLRVFLPIPGFQGLIRLACPAPFVLLALRRGPRAGLVATVASYILLSTFVGPVLATQTLVFGGVGTLFAWASQRRLHPAIAIVVGAILYGLLYLLLPFLLGLLALRVNLAKTLHDVHSQASSFLNSLGHLHLFGLPIGPSVTSGLSASGPGRALLDFLHGLALLLLTHPLATLIGFFACYSLANVWVYWFISVELYRRLPLETRSDIRGRQIDFFPVG